MITFIKKNYLIANIVWFQTIWFLAIFLHNKAIILIALLMVGHFFFTPKLSQDIKYLLIALTGIIIDSGLSLLNFYQFSDPPSFLFIPIWLMFLWCAFSQTLNHSLAWLTKLPLIILIPMGSFFGGLSYFSAYHLDAVNFPKDHTVTLVIIAAYWAVLMFFIARFSKRINN